MPSRTAVSISIAVMEKPPSPATPTTVRPGAASFAPIAPGTP